MNFCTLHPPSEVLLTAEGVRGKFILSAHFARPPKLRAKEGRSR
jgi:hypothetical protein